MHTYFKKPISALIVLSIVVGISTATIAPKQAEAIPVIDFSNLTQNIVQAVNIVKQNWREVLGAVLRRVASKVLLRTTKKVINYSLTGFQGDPFYVRDQGSFLSSIDDQVLLQSVSALTQGSSLYQYPVEIEQPSGPPQTYYCKTKGPSDVDLEGMCAGQVDQNLCKQMQLQNFTSNNCKTTPSTSSDGTFNPYGKSVAKALVKGYIAQKNLPKFNLDQATTGSWQDFVNGDFTQGGWKAWSAYTQNPANNPFGAFIESSEKTQEAQQAKTDTQKQELIQNGGFLSLKKCVAYKPGTSPTSTGMINLDGFTVSGQEVDNCLRYETTTPGTVIREQLSKAVTSPIDEQVQKTSSGSALIDSLADLASSLIGNGLDSLISNSISGSSTGGNGGLGNNGTFTTNQQGSTWYDESTDPRIESTQTPGVFNEDVQEVYTATEKEIGVLTEILTYLDSLPAKTRELDMCLPGPDLGWEARLRELYPDAVKPNNNSAASTEAYTEAKQDLDQFLENEIRDTKLSIVLQMPAASSIVNRVAQASQYAGTKQEIARMLNDRTGAFAQLKYIKTQLAQYRQQNNTTGISNLRKTYAQIQPQLGNSVTLDDAEGQLAGLKSDDQISFSRSNPNSLLSQCKTSRRQLGAEIIGQDQGKTLFCNWQNHVSSGSTTPGTLNDPVVPLIKGSGFTKTVPDLVLSLSTNKSVNIACGQYYTAPLSLYSQP